MKLRVPKLPGSRWDYLSVCATIDSSNTDALRYLEQWSREQVFSVGSPDGEMYVRITSGSPIHLHIDIASAEHFASSSPPKAQGGEAELRKALDPLAGINVEL